MATAYASAAALLQEYSLASSDEAKIGIINREFSNYLSATMQGNTTWTFKFARSQYKKHGRGLVLLHFTSVAQFTGEGGPQRAMYVTSRDVAQSFGERLVKHLQVYDPDAAYVLGITCVIDPAQASRVQQVRFNFGTLWCKAKSMDQVVMPDPACITVVQSERRCFYPNCTQTLGTVPFRVCARCRFARYCSKECQRADWSAHKPSCFAVERPNHGMDSTDKEVVQRSMDNGHSTA